MKRLVLAIAGVLALAAAAQAQTLTAEAQVTAGQSSGAATAGGVQARLFGPIGRGWKVFLEGTWAGSSQSGSDAFAASYPYDKRLHPMETYVERTFHPGTLLVGLRAGRYRTPFGIHDHSDHSYLGFARPPLIRYGGNFALSNLALETGADVLIGVPALSVEASLGRPLDADTQPRPSTIDGVVRVQGYFRSVVAGASYLNTRTYDMGPFVVGRMIFKGVDARWMADGVQIRGEWIDGRSFDGVATRGGYIDAIVHKVAMGPVTAVARAERLDYYAGPYSFFPVRYTAGVRVRVARETAVQFDLLHQRGGALPPRAVTFDLGVTQTFRF